MSHPDHQRRDRLEHHLHRQRHRTHATHRHHDRGSHHRPALTSRTQPHQLLRPLRLHQPRTATHRDIPTTTTSTSTVTFRPFDGPTPLRPPTRRQPTDCCGPFNESWRVSKTYLPCPVASAGDINLVISGDTTRSLHGEVVSAVERLRHVANHNPPPVKPEPAAHPRRGRRRRRDQNRSKQSGQISLPGFEGQKPED